MRTFEKILVLIGISIFVTIFMFFLLLAADTSSSTAPTETIEVENQTLTSRSSEKPTVDKKDFKDVILENDGNYFVGEDIAPGLYNIECVEGTGTVMSTDSRDGFLASFDENKLYKKVNLTDGQKIEVFGVKVKFVRIG